ncbi:unnamed protein product, partial [Prorocentrum cordatum]
WLEARLGGARAPVRGRLAAGGPQGSRRRLPAGAHGRGGASLRGGGMQQAKNDDDDGLPLLLGTPMEWARGSAHRLGETGRPSSSSSLPRKPTQDIVPTGAHFTEDSEARVRPRRAHDICMVFKCKTSKDSLESGTRWRGHTRVAAVCVSSE